MMTATDTHSGWWCGSSLPLGEVGGASRHHGGLTHAYADEVVLHYLENDETDSAKAYMDTVHLLPLRLALLGTLMGEGDWDAADSLLTAFHDSCAASPMGILARAALTLGHPMYFKDSLWVPLSALHIQKVLDSVSAISSGITPEATLRDLLEVALEHHLDTALMPDSVGAVMDSLLHAVFPDSTFTLPAIGRKALSSAHRTSLEALAEECPYEYGHGVHMARAMLSRFDSIPYLDVHECETPMPPPSEKLGEEEEGSADDVLSAEERHIRVYPNPTSGDVDVEMMLEEHEEAMLTVHDAIGARVLSVALRSGTNTVGTSSMRQGLYMFTVTVNGERRHTVRQVILK